MLSWKQFSEARPDLARLGGALFYEHGVGLGFLATVRADGGHRVHPICPLLTEEGLYAFIVPGPGLADLRRDGRGALRTETFPPPRQDDAFYVTGRVSEPASPGLRGSLTARLLAERDMGEPWAGFEEEVLVEFGIERCLLTLTREGDGLPAGHTVWHC